MSDIKINGMGQVPDPSGSKPASAGDRTNSFDQIMQEAMGKINQVQADADNAVKELTSGGDPVQAIIAMEKANMNFQLMVEVRNKLISAYEEVMRMQV